MHNLSGIFLLVLENIAVLVKGIELKEWHTLVFCLVTENLFGQTIGFWNLSW